MKKKLALILALAAICATILASVAFASIDPPGPHSVVPVIADSIDPPGPHAVKPPVIPM